MKTRLWWFEKALLSEITRLSQQKWFCFATNRYFSARFERSKDWVSRCISGLAKAKKIRVVLYPEYGNRRKLYVLEDVSSHKIAKKRATLPADWHDLLCDK